MVGASAGCGAWRERRGCNFRFVIFRFVIAERLPYSLLQRRASTGGATPSRLAAAMERGNRVAA